MSGGLQEADGLEYESTVEGRGRDEAPLEGDALPLEAAEALLQERPASTLPTAPAGFPVSNVVEIKQHRKAVVTLDVDRSGARLATGSLDYTLALFDFAGMAASLNPFRFLAPVSGAPLRFLRFSPAGEYLLLAAGSSMRLLDRHGGLQVDYRKGDPYLRDMRVTQGHVGNILAGEWSKEKKEQFATAGQDGTIRFWDVGAKRACVAVLVVKAGRPGRLSPQITRLKCLSEDAIVCGASDGLLRIYSARGPWINPVAAVEAHGEGAMISGLAVSRSGHLLASRATDDTLKRTISSATVDANCDYSVGCAVSDATSGGC